MIALHLHDAGILVAASGPSQGPWEPSPGFALLEDGNLRLGVEAARRARLHPRHLCHDFWDRMDRAPLGRPFEEGLTRADLAHAHLDSIWQRARGLDPADGAVLLAPGWYAKEQLSLLLGVAAAAGIPVHGMMDMALAAVGGADPGEVGAGKLLFLDLCLHRAVLTRFELGNQIARTAVESVEGVGLIALFDAWRRLVAEAFVRQTRFDPLHAAVSEQSLADQLPAHLATAAKRGSVGFEMSHAGRELSVELSRDQLAEAVDGMYRRIEARLGGPESGELLLAARLAELPGLVERLRGTGRPVRTVEPRAALEAALAHSATPLAPGQAVPFVTRLPRATTGTPTAESPTAAEIGSRPTHLLYRARAWPIRGGSLVVGTAPPAGERRLVVGVGRGGVSRSHCRLVETADGIQVEDLSRHGTFVNRQRIQDRRILQVGDRLTLGAPDVELTAIQVEDSHGPA